MAPLNPSIQPTNEPRYGQDSRAIDTPDPIRVQGVQQNQILPKGQEIGDRSAEYLGQAKAYGMAAEGAGNKAWGDLFANLVQTGDFLGKAGVQLVKKDIENRVYEVANRERENYTEELEKLRAGGLKNILDANASAEDVPSEVSGIGDTLATLKNARDGGKITKTDYQGRLLAEAKRLRAQYPGFKNEIDQEFSKVTGMNPANARINSLITEINRAAASNASSQNKMETFIRQAITAGVPRAEEYMARWRAGDMTDFEVFSKIGNYHQATERLNRRALENKDKAATREEEQTRGRETFEQASGLVVAGFADTLLGKLQLNSPSDVERVVAMEKNGQIPKQTWEQLNMEVQRTITNLRVKMTADADRFGLTRQMGGKEELNKRISEAMKPLEEIQKSIISRDVGGLYTNARESQGLIDETQNRMLTDSKAGPMWRTVAAIKNLGGEQYIQTFSLERALGKDGLPEATKGWYDRWVGELQAQTGKSVDGQVRTFNDMVSEMKTKKIDDPKTQAKIIGGIVKEVEKTAVNPQMSDKLKVNVYSAAFSEGNNRFLSKLQMDGVDQNGRPVRGMNAVYQAWTSEAVTKDIYRIGDKELIKQYESWAKQTFTDELSPREIQDLSNIKDPNIKIGWNDKSKQFEPRYMGNETAERGRPGLTRGGSSPSGREGTSTEFAIVQRSINRLNSNAYNLRRIAEASGRQGDEVDTFILQTIADSSGGSLRDISGLPQQMIYNLALGRQKKQQ